MALQIPDKFTIKYLKENINNSEWAEYVILHCETILDNLTECPFEEACLALSYSLSIWVGGKEKTEKTKRANDLVIRVSRMGVNKLLKDFSYNRISYPYFCEKQGDLLTKCAVGLINVGRPIAALNILGTAEKSFEEL